MRKRLRKLLDDSLLQILQLLLTRVLCVSRLFSQGGSLLSSMIESPTLTVLPARGLLSLGRFRSLPKFIAQKAWMTNKSSSTIRRREMTPEVRVIRDCCVGLQRLISDDSWIRAITTMVRDAVNMNAPTAARRRSYGTNTMVSCHRRRDIKAETTQLTICSSPHQ